MNDDGNRPRPDGPGDSSSRTVGVLALVLALLALGPRIAELGDLSFYGDEETTAFPARSMATGNGPTMPSGMTYPRALPLTVLNAGSAKIFGLDQEISYRLPSAILGALTVPLLFLFGRRFVGESAALVAATLLATSEWHLVYSRMARMYAPFLFFFLLAVWGVWTWARRDDLRSLGLAIAATLAAASLHTFALFAVALAVVPIGLERLRRTEEWKLLAFVGLAGGGLYALIRSLYVVRFGQTPPPQATEASEATWQIAAVGTGWLPWLLVAFGAGLGGWAAVRALGEEPGDDRHPIRYIGLVLLLAAAGGFAAAGLVYGAGLAVLLFLLVFRGSLASVWRRAWPQLAAGGAVCGLQVVRSMVDVGAAEAAKEALVFPFPYLGVVAREFPVLTTLFLAVVLWLAFARNRDDRDGLRAVALAALLPLVVVGTMRQWGGMRYLLPAYPFLLLGGAAGLTLGGRWLTERVGGGQRLAVGAVLGAVLAGLVGHHGIPATVRTVTLEHGEAVDAELHQDPYRPDHEGAGEFLRSNRSDGDVIVAEDPLQQRWYAGEVDYWLRSYRDARAYLYVADEGILRDIYVDSRLVPDVDTLSALAPADDHHVWVVTSGETAYSRDYYLDERQHRWLDSLESAREPAHTARDSATKVYCLDC